MARFRLIPREERFFEDFVGMAEELRGGARLLKQMLAVDPPDVSKADAIKDVYRDLLSNTDKALEGNNKDDKKASAERIYTYIDTGGEGDRQPVKFKGLLSIGVHEASNTLLVSARQDLLEDVEFRIKQLDEVSRSTSTTGVPSVGRSSGAVRLPAVYTGSCSRRMTVSGRSPETTA